MNPLNDTNNWRRRLSDDDLIDHLAEGHVDYHGGYAFDCAWVGDAFVVASLDWGKDGNATKLELVSREHFNEWVELANEFRVENKEGDKAVCFFETDPR